MHIAATYQLSQHREMMVHKNRSPFPRLTLGGEERPETRGEAGPQHQHLILTGRLEEEEELETRWQERESRRVETRREETRREETRREETRREECRREERDTMTRPVISTNYQ